MLHGARCKYRMQKIVKKSPYGHHLSTLSGYIFAIKARIDNRRKLIKQQYLLHIFPQYGELGPLVAEIGLVVWGTPANFNGFRILAALLYGTSVLGVSQTLRALNRGRYLYLAGRPSRWALAHILVLYMLRLVSCIQLHCFFYSLLLNRN